MNKKVIIWGAVIIGTALLVRHYRKTQAAETARKAQTPEAKSNASGSYPCAAPNADCAAACTALGGRWNQVTRTCDGIVAKR